MGWWDDVEGGASGSSGASGGAGGNSSARGSAAGYYDPFGNVSGGAGGNSSAGGSATGYGILETLLNPRNPFDELSSSGDGGARPPNAGFNYTPVLLIGVAVVIAIVVLKK